VVRCDNVTAKYDRWLAKPLSGSGGRGIRFAPARRAHTPTYFQEFIEGESRSAIFRDGELLGVTRQLVGEPWLHAPRFGYCGSIGPIASSLSELDAWRKLGEFLMSWAGLRRIFGIDAIMRDGVPWLIEVNPRYTASVELIELTRGIVSLSPSPPSPLPRSGGEGRKPSPRTLAVERPKRSEAQFA